MACLSSYATQSGSSCMTCGVVVVIEQGAECDFADDPPTRRQAINGLEVLSAGMAGKDAGGGEDDDGWGTRM